MATGRPVGFALLEKWYVSTGHRCSNLMRITAFKLWTSSYDRGRCCSIADCLQMPHKLEPKASFRVYQATENRLQQRCQGLPMPPHKKPILLTLRQSWGWMQTGLCHFTDQPHASMLRTRTQVLSSQPP